MALHFNYNREINQVLIEGDSFCKKVILNRPEKLNCLNYEMILQLLKNFQALENDSTIKLVILKGNGKAFCAGGDVASVALSCAFGHWSFGARFYQKQFSLDYMLGTYKKPLVSLINGIVMGGGAGLTMHGSFRIVTEKAIFAMPEASIGLYPDVGASHFLSRLPGHFGEYLGLTGARLDGAEMLACGLATHFVFSKDLPLLENSIQAVASSSNPTAIHEVVSNFAQKPSIKANSAYKRLDIINKCFSKQTVEEIVSCLEKEINKIERNKWIMYAVSSMKSASPISLKISLRSIREGRLRNLKQCLTQEYTITCNILRATVSSDGYEGSRAMILHKDRKPKWEPSKLELVSKKMVDHCFEGIDEDEWEFLQLPNRPNAVHALNPKL